MSVRLIIVDGLDGVGKDTHARLIKEFYENRGETVMVRSHPESDNFYGRIAKRSLLGSGRINQLKASVFYAIDVLESLRLYYRPRQYDTLIIVRYLMGTAYLPRTLARFAYLLFEKFVPTSEYMFFLDADPDELLERIKRRNEVEMFETYDALVKVRGKALLLAKGWHVIETSGSVEDTFSRIKKILVVDEC